ncbi:MAG: histidine kinase [Verrucomicrobia bacterium]|nr:histidine kinase [Verrucomicrobiota bacterium]
MDVIISKVCVLVTAAFVLTLLPGFRRSDRSLLSARDRGTALLVFLLLGLLEEVAARQNGWINHRIVAVCAAGLLAGPSTGILVAIFVTWLAVVYGGMPFYAVGASMLLGGVAGGLINQWRPKLAEQPSTGFVLTFGISALRDGLVLLLAPVAQPPWQAAGQLFGASVLQGFGTALVLAIVAQVRDRDEQALAAASAEVRALQARMNPHFLFNALNSLSALATIAPRQVPRAAARLRQFLRASFDQQERTLVPMQEEMEVVQAYLEIEALRFGSRLKLEQIVDPGLTSIPVPPFSLQPLVENAVQHGLQSSPTAGRLTIEVHSIEGWLEMKVSDDGEGIPSDEVEKTFFADGRRAHALLLLRRRLQGLFGSAFKLDVSSSVGVGTTVIVRIPLQPPVEVVGRSLSAMTDGAGRLVCT